ncbi:MAG: DUF2155 domain-containing protein [Alphaproteobacteria bacterium]|nr:DUF2155 domain-containing protein [Alphaproteobacteria bacterium]
MKKLLFLSVFFCCSSVFGADIETKTMMIRGVDKVTGHVSTVKATVHEPLEFGSLMIIPEKCLTKPPEETPENAAFFRIFEKDSDGVQQTVFNGWMFSSNPALSAMEHARYDIWVLYCINDDLNSKILSPEKISQEEDLNLVAEDDNPALSEESED